jgi:hypothetical protein
MTISNSFAVIGVAAVLAAACASSGAAPSAAAAPAPTGESGAACSPATVDSAFSKLGTVYRNCDVDRPAKALDSPVRPRLTGITLRRCMSADIEFVVDSNGHPIPDPVKVVRTTSPDFAALVRSTVAQQRYLPAVKDGKHVQQLVLMKEQVITSDEASAIGGLSGASVQEPLLPQPGC